MVELLWREEKGCEIEGEDGCCGCWGECVLEQERVDGWKMKQEKNVVPMSTGLAASERGAGDVDASTDVLVDDSLL